MTDTSRQVNPRIPVQVFDKLEEEALKKGLSITTLAGNILEDYAEKKSLKEERGDLMVGKKILSHLLECGNNPKHANTNDNEHYYDNMLTSNTDKAASEILAEWRLQTDILDLKEFHKRILGWHNLNKLRIKCFDINEHVRYVIKHDMGLSWSEFNCMMYCKMLEKIGVPVTTSEFDGISYSIEIPSHEKIDD